MSTFFESLRVMGLGMLGIFIVTIVLIAIMMLLTKRFPAKGNHPESTSAPANEEQPESDPPADGTSR